MKGLSFRGRTVLLATVLSSCLAAEERPQGDRLPELLAAVKGSDPEARRQAAEAIPGLGAAAVGPLFEIHASPDRSASRAARLALEALVHRAGRPGADAERAAVTALLVKHVGAGCPTDVRRYACELLSYIGGDDAVPALANLLKEPELAETARQALVRIPGEKAVQALADALAEAPPALKVGIIDALGRRQHEPSAPALVSLLDNEDAAVVFAAAEALGRIGVAETRHPVRRMMNRGTLEQMKYARDAFMRLAEVQLAKGDKTIALRMFMTAYQSAIEEHDMCAALIGMARAGGADTLPTMLQALRSPSAEIRSVASGALIGFEGTPVTEALVEALGDTSGERRQVLLAVLGGRKDPAALPALIANTKEEDEGVRAAAIRAIGEIGDPGGFPEILAALSDGSDAIRQAAEDAVNRMPGKGVKADFARRAGFVTRWHLIGPFAGTREELRDKELIPDVKKVDLGAEVKAGDKVYRWKPYRTASVQGIVDLTLAIAQMDSAAAYAYAEVTVDKPLRVRLNCGSDDEIAVWLNGAHVHGHTGDRALRVDEDSVPAELAAGTNRILLKVTNGGGGWAFCVRITDEEHNPIKFEERTE